MTILQKVITLAKAAREFGLTRFLDVQINTLHTGSNWLRLGFLFFFFFLIFISFFLSTWVLVLQISTGKEGERREDTSSEEGEESTWGWFSHGEGLGYEVVGVHGITRLENNRIGNPIVNPGRLSISMRGVPTSPYGGKTKYVLSKGVTWLVVLEGEAITM